MGMGRWYNYIPLFQITCCISAFDDSSEVTVKCTTYTIFDNETVFKDVADIWSHWLPVKVGVVLKE